MMARGLFRVAMKNSRSVAYLLRGENSCKIHEKSAKSSANEITAERDGINFRVIRDAWYVMPKSRDRLRLSKHQFAE